MALSSAGTKIRGRSMHPASVEQYLLRVCSEVHQTLPACFLSMSFLDGRLRVIFSLDAFYRLKTFEPAGAPIADLKYDPTSTALAYAVSYDWNKVDVTVFLLFFPLSCWRPFAPKSTQWVSSHRRFYGQSSLFLQGPDQQEMAKGHHVYIHAVRICMFRNFTYLFFRLDA